MELLLLWVGRLAGIAGALLCAWAIYSRLTGSYFVGGFQVGTLLQAGTTALLVACVCFLAILTNRPRR